MKDDNFSLGKWVSMADDSPPCDGLWEILVDQDKYFATYKEGEWSSGNKLIEEARGKKFYPYPRNNDPKHPIKWRGKVRND